MDFETVEADAFGKSLKGIGLNLLVRDVVGLCKSLEKAFGMKAHPVSQDFAIVSYGAQLFQLHSDATYHAHPLPSLLPEAGARGAGLEIWLYNTDPDAACQFAEAARLTVLQPPTDKPHGLREC
ncbi:MAG: glyoxalase [Shimia sp.]|jgi:hypothetical protein|uniref:glyoxalase n=1 Tax=Shimia sp. TaxID=1954381 RepID=UPI00405921B5